MVTIAGSEARHIGKVLRLRENDSITLFDGDGTIYNGTIIRKDQKQILVRIDDRSVACEQQDNHIILGQALPKATKMDFIVQKSTELGISRIIPFCSMRTVVRYDAQKANDRVRHWQRIAVEAAKQSGTRHIPAVEQIEHFKTLIEHDFDGYLKILLWEEEHALLLRQSLKPSVACRKIIFLVGPEGGFDREEVTLAREHGFTPVSLGAAVLRTETVSIAVLSVIRYEMGDLG